jgi:flagellar FliL protein
MADELPIAIDEIDTSPTTPTAPAPPRRSAGSIKETLAATLVVTALSAAMGAVFATPPPAPPPPPPADKTALTLEVPAAAGMFDMPPIVTNLGSPSEVWIRLEASIVYDAKALPHPDVMAEEIAGDELAYLRSVSISQLEGPIGLQNIRQDLNDRAAIRSGGKVSELIIRTLVLQ